MRIRKRLAAIIAALGLIGLIVGYRESDCPSIDPGKYDTKYDAAIIISGGPVPKPKNLNDPAFTDTRIRIEHAADLHEKGLFPYIVLTGTPEDIELMSGYLNERNIPWKPPARNHYNTTGDMLAGYEIVPDRSKIAWVFGKEQSPRGGLVIEKENLDPENDDGVFPIKDTYDGKWLGIPRLRERVACTLTRFGLEDLKGIYSR